MCCLDTDCFHLSLKCEDEKGDCVSDSRKQLPLAGKGEVFRGGTGWFQHDLKQRHSALLRRGGCPSAISTLGC